MGCGKSKHAAIEHSISRKSSRAGSKRAKAPITSIGKGRKLERNASTLMTEDGRNVTTRKNSRAVHDEIGVAGSTESKKQKKIDINDYSKDKKYEDAETSCGEQKCDVTENMISTKNSRVGSEGGDIPEIRIEEIFELDAETSSTMKEENPSDGSSGGDNSKGLAEGNGIIAEIKELEKRGNTLETIEEMSERESDSTSLMKEEDKSVDKDSSSSNSQTVFDENGKAKSIESQELIEETSETDENTSSLTKGGGENVDQDPRVDGNGMVESIELKEPIEETIKTDENASSLMEAEIKSVDQDSIIADKSEAVVEENGVELKNQGNVENGNDDKEEQNEGKEDTLEDKKLVQNAKEDTLDDKKLAENAKEDTLEDKKLAENAKESANDEPEIVKGENLDKE